MESNGYLKLMPTGGRRARPKASPALFLPLAVFGEQPSKVEQARQSGVRKIPTAGVSKAEGFWA